MKLIDDWKRKFPKLWSVRLSLLAAVASSVEVGIAYFGNGKTLFIAAVATLFSFGAAIVRVIAQPSLDKPKE